MHSMQADLVRTPPMAGSKFKRDCFHWTSTSVQGTTKELMAAWSMMATVRTSRKCLFLFEAGWGFVH
eukprot:1158392-Pelagomonas_calceolata.AAC.5